VNERVPVAYEVSCGLDTRVRFPVLEIQGSSVSTRENWFVGG
jgi:hypothetical protein